MDIKKVRQKGTEELRTDQVGYDKRETRSKLLFYASMGVLGIILIGIAVLIFWSVQMGTVLEIKNSPVPVRPTKIDSDQYILLHYDYCKHSDAEGVVQSSLVSKTSVLVLPEARDTTKEGCNEFDAPYPVPGQTAPEIYHYHFKACYPLNPVKEVCIEWDSKEFEIQGPEPKREIKITYKK